MNGARLTFPVLAAPAHLMKLSLLFSQVLKNVPASMLSVCLSASLNGWKQLESECLVIIHPDDSPGTWHTLGTWKKFVDLEYNRTISNGLGLEMAA